MRFVSFYVIKDADLLFCFDFYVKNTTPKLFHLKPYVNEDNSYNISSQENLQSVLWTQNTGTVTLEAYRTWT